MPKKSSKLEPSLYPAAAVERAVAEFRAGGADVAFAGGELTASAATLPEAEALFDELANYIAGLAAQSA